MKAETKTIKQLQAERAAKKVELKEAAKAEMYHTVIRIATEILELGERITHWRRE